MAESYSQDKHAVGSLRLAWEMQRYLPGTVGTLIQAHQMLKANWTWGPVQSTPDVQSRLPYAGAKARTQWSYCAYCAGRFSITQIQCRYLARSPSVLRCKDGLLIHQGLAAWSGSFGSNGYLVSSKVSLTCTMTTSQVFSICYQASEDLCAQEGDTI